MGAYSVLVVEDTELLRRIYSDKLSQDGYQVLTASDGMEALAVLHANKVDLVLLDLIMPRMSGLEALEAIKADPRTREIPVIILSNLGQESDVERGLSLGAVDYLVKNEARPADVAEKIAATLDLMAGRQVSESAYRVLLRDREGDADRLVTDASLPRRFWCPACEVELVVELLAKPNQPGWYDAHIVCPTCGKEY